MTASVLIWLAAAGVLAVLSWVAVARQARRFERWASPAVLGCLLVAAAVATPRHDGVQGWLIAALAFGVLGHAALCWQPQPVLDLALLPAGRAEPVVGRAEPVKVPRLRANGLTDSRAERTFLLGSLSFLLGHLCYLCAMIRYGTDRLSVMFGLLLVLIALFAFGYRIIAGANVLGGALLSFGVSGYLVVLGSAVVLGVGTAQLWVAYGIVLFAVSDLLLAADRFVQARPAAPVTVIVSHQLAQALLLIGLLR